MEKSENGITFLEALTLLFIGLKLTKHIDWSWWWWILSPIIFVFICMLVGCLLGLIMGIHHRRSLIKQFESYAKMGREN